MRRERSEVEGWSAEVSFFTFGSNVIITEHFLVTWSPEELPDQNISVSHGDLLSNSKKRIEE